MLYTTANFVAAVKNLAAIPTNQNRFTPAVILGMADREIRANILPMILRTRESYYSYTYDVALDGSGIYPIPSRASGIKLEDAKLKNGDEELSLSLVDEADVTNRNYSPNANSFSFYFKGNKVYLAPYNPGMYTQLSLPIFLRPSTLIELSSAARITQINIDTVTCANVPTTFSTATPLDAVKASAHFDCLAIDQVPASVVTGTNGTIQFSILPSGLAVGDYVCLAEQAPVVQLPVEAIPLLEQRTANAILRAQGDYNGLRAGQEAAKEMADSILSLFTPRVEGEGKKLISRSGLLRRR